MSDEDSNPLPGSSPVSSRRSFSSNLYHSIMGRQQNQRRYKYTKIGLDSSDTDYTNSPWHTESHLMNTFSFSRDTVKRLNTTRTLSVNTNYVSAMTWSPRGEYLLTGGDNELVLTDYYNGGKVLAKIDTAGRFVQTSRFMHASNNEVIALSAGSEGSIELHNVYRFSNTFYPQKRIASASCHSELVLDLVTTPDDPTALYSLSADKTCRKWDVREKFSEITKPLIESESPLSSISISGNFMAVGGRDPTVRLYDLRNTEHVVKAFSAPQTVLSLSPYHPRLGEVYVSGLQLSDNDLLVNYYGAAAYLYDVNESRNTELLSRSYYRNLTSHLPSDASDEEIAKVYHDAKFYKQVYSGHLNLRQLKPITFMGPNKEYVVAASDRETVFIWDTKSGDIVNIVTPDSNVEGDAFLSHVAPHPTEGHVLAVAGPASPTIRLLEPTLGPCDESTWDAIVANNVRRATLLVTTNLVSILRMLVRIRPMSDDVSPHVVFIFSSDWADE